MLTRTEANQSLHLTAAASRLFRVEAPRAAAAGELGRSTAEGAPMTEAEMLAGIRDVLRSLNAAAQATIRRELAEPIDLGHSERLQFEACPQFFGVKPVQTEEEVITDSAIRPPPLGRRSTRSSRSYRRGRTSSIPRARRGPDMCWPTGRPGTTSAVRCSRW